MLPILRIVPVGGVLLAILILVLALTPPDGSHRSLSPAAAMARGPLLDRDEHPEWRQFLIHAALRRADELNRLRELPDTPVRVAPPEPARSEPPNEVTSTADRAAHGEPVAAAASEPLDIGGTKPEEGQPAPVQSESPPPQDAPPENAQPATAEPLPAPAAGIETAPQQFAGLPADRNDTDPHADDVTGSIDQSPGATIPIDIGETSSTELPVVLPEERPPVLRTPERAKPPHESRRKRVRRVRQVKVAPQPPPEPLGFFELLFGTAKIQQVQAPVAAPKRARKAPVATKPAPRIRAVANRDRPGPSSIDLVSSAAAFQRHQ